MEHRPIAPFRAFALFAILLLSCGGERSQPSPAGDPTATRPTFEPAAVTTAPPQASGGTTASTDGSPRLNPPHGEPGHRCEIPVGAPLDGSAPAEAPGNIQPVEIGTPAPTAQPVAQPPAQTAPGMSGKPNPPHGEPGHRCDVQVGDPLP